MRDTDRMSVVGRLRAAMQAVQVGRFADALADVEWCREVLSVKAKAAKVSTVPPPGDA